MNGTLVDEREARLKVQLRQPTQARQQARHEEPRQQRRQPHGHRGGTHRGGTSPHEDRLNVQPTSDPRETPEQHPPTPFRTTLTHGGRGTTLRIAGWEGPRSTPRTPVSWPVSTPTADANGRRRLNVQTDTTPSTPRRGLSRANTPGGGGHWLSFNPRLHTADPRPHGGGMGAHGRCERAAGRVSRRRRRTGAMPLVDLRRLCARLTRRRPKAGTPRRREAGSIPSDRDPQHTQIQGYSGWCRHA